jgi:ligand-binding SRPBCC domain-containing protein
VGYVVGPQREVGVVLEMETIRLTTWINAPVERCFRLSTSIDLHVASAGSTEEKAVDGVTKGLIGEGETVTWQGRHFGLNLRHTSRIDVWRPYNCFRDVMIDGVFQRFEHDHFFAPMNDGTRMRDEIRFSVPWGTLGRMAARMFLRKHLTQFLITRNTVIKRAAECEEWHKYLDGWSTVAPEASIPDQLVNRWDPKMKLV